jgi:hypothetical protein
VLGRRWRGRPGYYHRARNLHRAARHVVERHAGRFPRTLEEALAVPESGSTRPAPCSPSPSGWPSRGRRQRAASAGEAVRLRGPEWRRDGAANLAEELLQRSPGRLEPGPDGAGATVCVPHRPLCPAARCAPIRAELSLVEELPEGGAPRLGRRHGGGGPHREGRPPPALVRPEGRRLMGLMWRSPDPLESRGLPDLARRSRRPRLPGDSRPPPRPRTPRDHLPPHPPRGLPRQPPSTAARRPRALSLGQRSRAAELATSS